jgi:monothiol glutaredoxin
VDVLQDVGVPFATFDILSDPNMRQGVKDYAQWPTFPQLYVGGEFVGGCDIVTEMYQNGELQTLIKGVG